MPSPPSSSSLPSDRPEDSADGLARSTPDTSQTVVLIYGARRGDQRAFVRLYERNRRWLRASAAFLIGEDLPYVDAEDLLQETFAYAFRKIQEGEFELAQSEGAFRHFLGKVLRNKARDAARRAKAKKRVPEKCMVDLYSSTISAIFDNNGATPSQHMMGAELASGVRRAIARLSEQDRRVLHYRLVCRMSYEEMLPELTMIRNGKPLLDEAGEPVPVTKVGTAKSMFCRARQRLLDLLRDQGLVERAEGAEGQAAGG